MADKVSYRRSETVNLGNYESKKVEVGYETEVREGEAPQEAVDRAKDLVDFEIDQEVER